MIGDDVWAQAGNLFVRMVEVEVECKLCRCVWRQRLRIAAPGFSVVQVTDCTGVRRCRCHCVGSTDFYVQAAMTLDAAGSPPICLRSHDD